jgi:predicted nucleic acid-binding protein
MGLILDSSVVIAAERRGETVERLIERVVSVAGDQDAALSAVGLTELIHGVYRAQSPQMRVRRETFLQELLADVTVYPYTKETASCPACRIRARPLQRQRQEQKKRGQTDP